MFSTLRRRLIFSHILPLLVIVPLIGLALIYLLEARVVLPSLTNELTSQAGLVVEMARDQPGVWSDPTQAQAFVARVSRDSSARLMVLDGSGQLLASSDPNDRERLGAPLDHPGLGQALSGQLFTQAARSQGLHAEVADVLAPAPGSDQHVAGVVRLSYPLTTVYVRFRLLRYLVAGVLVVGLLLGAIAAPPWRWTWADPSSKSRRPCGSWPPGNYRLRSLSRARRRFARWRSLSTRWRSGCARWKSPGASCWPTWCTKSGAPWACCWRPCKPSRAARIRIRHCARNCRQGWKRRSGTCNASWMTWHNSTTECWERWSWTRGHLPWMNGSLRS